MSTPSTARRAPVLTLAVVATLGALTGCSTRYERPPAAPRAEFPAGLEMPTTPPEAGKTRTAIDADGERASVIEITERVHAKASVSGVTADSETTRPVCVTPCVVDLAPGMHALRFASEKDETRYSEANIQITESPKVVRHAMGRRESSPGLWILGFTLTTLGFSAGGAGVGLAATTKNDDDRRTGIVAAASIGGAVAVAGIVMMALGRNVEQYGSTTEFALRK